MNPTQSTITSRWLGVKYTACSGSLACEHAMDTAPQLVSQVGRHGGSAPSSVGSRCPVDASSQPWRDAIDAHGVYMRSAFCDFGIIYVTYFHVAKKAVVNAVVT